MKKISIRQMYYSSIVCHMFTLICGIAGSIVFLSYSKEFVSDINETWNIIFTIAVAFMLIFLALASLRTLIALFKDFRAIKSNDFISITAKVVRFKKNLDPEAGTQINNKPIVVIENTSDEIALYVEENIQVGETYKFNYLKNCKIAEIVDRI